MERSIILYFENINTQQKSKTLTPLQKLQAENERRRDELDLKREDLADKKSFRQIGSVLMSPYTQRYVTPKVASSVMTPNSVNMVGKLSQGKQYLEKPVTIPQW
jgi:hypothetical protein